MRGWRLGVVLVVATALGGPESAVAARLSSLTARTAIIMDAASGEVLWERDSTRPLPPASTTKIMTAILALESGRLDDSFTVSRAATLTVPTKINLRAGQKMRLRNLLYAVLLNSANDAAHVVAEGLAGSIDSFAARMNIRARQLGANTAHFKNPHGLSAPGHEASARDLAIIFRHGLRLPLFREILETRSVSVPVESSRLQWVSLRSHNRLLTGYQYQVIGKTGYTRLAKRCFVGAASHDNREIVIALLGARDLWGDAKRLLEYGFSTGVETQPVLMARERPTPVLTQAPAIKPLVGEGDDGAMDDDEPPSPAPHYAVQIGPYKSRKTAVSTRALLARRGYSAALRGRALRIGSFSTAARAERLASRLRRTGYRPHVVAVN
jgi:serine-type D-Ala-D-Ala carboxypeptidase (penicillin-binding protein 5/6)